MNNFLVLGLPRSRTAWLANFLSYDGLKCTHEGINGCQSVAEYRNKFIDNMGDSNTGLALFNFERYFNDFKIVVIDSDIKHSVDFTREKFGFDPTNVMKLLKARLNSVQGLHIDFNDIDSRLEELWDYLSPTQFNETRAAMLTGFDVQVRDVYSHDENSMKAIINNEKPYAA